MKSSDIKPGHVYALKNSTYSPTPMVAVGALSVITKGINRDRREVRQAVTGERSEGLVFLIPMGPLVNRFREWAELPDAERPAPPIPDEIAAMLGTLLAELRRGGWVNLREKNDAIGKEWYFLVQRPQTVVGEFVSVMTRIREEHERYRNSVMAREERRAHNQKLREQAVAALAERGLVDSGLDELWRADTAEPLVQFKLSTLRTLLGLEN